MSRKNNFLLNQKYKKQFINLSDEEAGKLIKAIFMLNDDENIDKLKLSAKSEGYLEIIKDDIDDNAKKYKERCNQNRKNINERWSRYREGKGSTNDTNVYERIPLNNSYYDNDSYHNHIISYHNHKEGKKGVGKKEEKAKFNKAQIEEWFNQFWKLYTPIKCSGKFVAKGSKEKAQEKYTHLIKSGVDPQEILRGLQLYLTHCKENDQLTCGVCVFLNQKKWLDEYGNEVESDNNKKTYGVEW